MSLSAEYAESMTLCDNNDRCWSRSVKQVSDGAFSVVYLGMSDDGRQVAIKCIPPAAS